MSPNSCADREQSSCPEVSSVVLCLSPVKLYAFCFDSLNTISRLFCSSWQLISAVNSILKLGNSPWNWEKQQKRAVQVNEQDNSLDNSAAALRRGGCQLLLLCFNTNESHCIFITLNTVSCL